MHSYIFMFQVVTLSGETAYATEVPNYCADTTQTSSALPSGATEGNIYVYGSQTGLSNIQITNISREIFDCLTNKLNRTIYNEIVFKCSQNVILLTRCTRLS